MHAMARCALLVHAVACYPLLWHAVVWRMSVMPGKAKAIICGEWAVALLQCSRCCAHAVDNP